MNFKMGHDIFQCYIYNIETGGNCFINIFIIIFLEYNGTTRCFWRFSCVNQFFKSRDPSVTFFALTPAL